MTKLNLHSLRRLAGSVALLALLFFSPQMMRADTAAQIRDQINAFTGGGTGSLLAVTTSATNVVVAGTLTGVTTKLSLNIDAGVTVSWTATISSTANITNLISLTGSGTFEVTGGAVTATNCNAISANTDVAITVSGGTVSCNSSSYSAIFTNGANSKITVSGGTVSTTIGTAVFTVGANSLVTVSGTGQVQATGNGGIAINAGGNVQVSGTAWVTATTEKAILAQGASSTVTVSGGLVFAYGSAITGSNNVIYLGPNPSGFTSATGTGVVIAWNQAAGHTTYTKGSSDDISKSPASATATWDVQGGSAGITYVSGGIMGFIPVSGVSVQANDAATPTITTQPQNATVNVGAAVTLSVTASVSDGGALSYQWYNTSGVPTLATAISGATGSIYSPPTSSAGTSYYCVVVRNTNNNAPGAKTATATSNTVTVTVNAPVGNAAMPTIKTQPQSATVNVGAAATLSVTASVSDGGMLSYQWYHTSSPQTLGTAISGATAANYSPPTSTAGTYYYYVVVTNTNNGASGNKTATATSTVAIVTVNAAPSVCSIGTTGYTSLDSALAAITTNAKTTIMLLQDITHSGGCTISNRNITFNLNGKNLLFNGGTGAPALKLTNSAIDYTGTGTFKVISTGNDGLNISGGSCTLTYAETSASAGGQTAVFCLGGGKVTVNGNVTTTGDNGGIAAGNGGAVITVNGDVTSDGQGASANQGGSFTVNGNITAGARAIHADGGLNVTVTGNVWSTGDWGIYSKNSNVQINVGGVVTSSSNWGIVAESGTISVGNVNASNGVMVSNKGTTVTVDGTITASKIYIQTGSTSKTINNYESVTTLTGYLTYTDGTSTVWVKSAGATPTIIAQPQSVTVNTGKTATLIVTASVSDGGMLSYQWYRNNTNSSSGGTAIGGATGNGYSPSTTIAGTYYYYVVVTNTNNGVSGKTTATATSAVAIVTITNGTGIENVSQTNALKAWVQNGTLHVSGLTAGKPWRVYTVTSVLVTSPGPSKGGEEVTTSLPGHGIYIVQSGNWTVKVMSEP